MLRVALPLLAVFFLLCNPSPGADGPRPNVLFLFSDDQRADTIAALGNPIIRTPNLDALVSRGTAFTRAYSMGAQQGAVCVPSRAMLMTGRTLFRIKENLAGQTTWPEMFAQAGYRTFMTGKWHNGAESALRVREDRWKLIVYPAINKTQLFDLAADPAELNDLAADPQHADEVTRLTDLLRAGQKLADDPQPLHTDKPVPAESDFSKVKRNPKPSPGRSGPGQGGRSPAKPSAENAMKPPSKRRPTDFNHIHSSHCSCTV